MNPVKVLIVEDKAAVAEHIAAVMKQAGYIITGTADSGEDALEIVKNDQPDVILMDIQLSGELDGIRTTELLKKRHSIPVIYLTDYGDEGTIERAKHTRPANYLLKPFNDPALLIAIQIAFFNASTGTEAQPGQHESPVYTIAAMDDRFFIKDKGVISRIDLKDVLWIEADGSYYKIKTTKDTYHQVGTLSMFSEKYIHPMLIRVHRSYIVNIDKIVSLNGNLIMLEGEKEGIPTSKSYKDELHKRLRMI